ncbi:hypothetical protein CSHISOI_11007, partial [Colletotrichum shisoi]
MWLDGRRLEYGEPIECPYCRTIQVIRDRYHWKHHVYRDLQAYVCTFKDCSAEPFQTSHEWFKHELGKHRRQWKCALCHAKCVSASALEAHFDSRHPGVGVRCAEKGDAEGFWNPSSIANGNSDKFRSHLAKHFQELACEAIPLAIEGLAVQDDSDTDPDPTTSDGDDHGTEDGEMTYANWVPIGKHLKMEGLWKCVHLESRGLVCPNTYSSSSLLNSHFREQHELTAGPELQLNLCRGCRQFIPGEYCNCAGAATRGYERWCFAKQRSSLAAAARAQQAVADAETRLQVVAEPEEPVKNAADAALFDEKHKSGASAGSVEAHPVATRPPTGSLFPPKLERSYAQMWSSENKPEPSFWIVDETGQKHSVPLRLEFIEKGFMMALDGTSSQQRYSLCNLVDANGSIAPEEWERVIKSGSVLGTAAEIGMKAQAERGGFKGEESTRDDGGPDAAAVSLEPAAANDRPGNNPAPPNLLLD